MSNLTTDQHTPGPWHWDSDPVKGDPTGRIRYRVCTIGKTITQVYYSSFEGGPTNAEADARLIAAAPELLTLAHQYASECAQCAGSGKVEMLSASGHPAGKVDCEDCVDIRAVIAKAEGKEHV